MTTTLLELAHHIASLQPSALPSPAIGTRLSFRLIYPDTASAYSSRGLPPDQAPPPRYLSKDLGSLVLGEGGPGIELPGDDEDEDNTTSAVGGDNAAVGISRPREVLSAAGKTLADAKFVVGDYLSVAVLPPDEGTGAVVPAAAAAAGVVGETGRMGRRPTLGSALGGVPPQGRRVNGFPVGQPGRGRGTGWRGGREWDGGQGRGRDRDGHSFPEGEWRRGERLPDGPPRGGRRGSRW